MDETFTRDTYSRFLPQTSPALRSQHIETKRLNISQIHASEDGALIGRFPSCFGDYALAGAATNANFAANRGKRVTTLGRLRGKVMGQ